MQIHTGVIRFRTAASGDTSRDTILVLALFADDDPCAPADLTFKEIGAVYNLSAVTGHSLRFKYRATHGKFISLKFNSSDIRIPTGYLLEEVVATQTKT
jgi:hypothetical protein